MPLPLTALAVIMSLTSGPAQLEARPIARPVPVVAEAVAPTPQPRAVTQARELPSARPELVPVQVEGPSSPADLPATEDTRPIPDLPAGEPVAVSRDTAEPYVEPSVVTGPLRAEILEDAARALAAVTTAEGRFVQIAPDYSISEGKFYLRRPGRVRFEYDEPVPILIVADGATVAIEDRDLETQDRVPLRTTPLALLLDDALDFETRANILNVRKAGGQIGIAMSDRSGETEGVLELILDAETYALQAWRTEDAAGGVTTVSLQEVETGTRINPRLFRIEDLHSDDERD